MNVAKEFLLKYVDSFCIWLSKTAEVRLIHLLCNKNYRNLTKEILVKHAKYLGLSDKGKTRFDIHFTLARLFKIQNYRIEFSYFYMKLQLA